MSEGDDQIGHDPAQPKLIPVRQVQSINGDNRGGADCYSFLRTAQSQPSNLDSNRSSFYMSRGDDQIGHDPAQPKLVPVCQVQSVNGDNRGGANRHSFLRTASK